MQIKFSKKVYLTRKMCFKQKLWISITRASYVEVDNEEMEYVDGGEYKKYTGWSAILELTNMYASVGTFGKVTASLVSAALAAALTVFGVVAAAIVIGFGRGGSLALTACAGTFAMLATEYYLADKGFRSNSFSIFGCTVYTGVKKL